MKIPLSEGGIHNRSNLIALCLTEGKLGYPTMIELFSRKPGYHLNVTESIHRYIEEISAVDESEIRLLQMGMPFDRNRGVELLKEIYL